MRLAAWAGQGREGRELGQAQSQSWASKAGLGLGEGG